jgi:hypothetical protein
MTDVIIWYKDIANFINKDNFNIFFPVKFMSYEEKLNSIMRLIIYTMIIFYLWTRNLKLSLIIIILASIVSIVMYEIYIETERKVALKNFQNNLININKKTCIKPTKDNPFMNVLPGNNLPTDIDTNDELKSQYTACNITNEKVKQQVEDSFDRDLYQDAEDIYGKKGGNQRFVSIPNEVSLNHQRKFAEWLYGDLEKTNKTVVW